MTANSNHPVRTGPRDGGDPPPFVMDEQTARRVVELDPLYATAGTSRYAPVHDADGILVGYVFAYGAADGADAPRPSFGIVTATGLVSAENAGWSTDALATTTLLHHFTAPDAYFGPPRAFTALQVTQMLATIGLAVADVHPVDPTGLVIGWTFIVESGADAPYGWMNTRGRGGTEDSRGAAAISVLHTMSR